MILYTWVYILNYRNPKLYDFVHVGLYLSYRNPKLYDFVHVGLFFSLRAQTDRRPNR